MTEALDEGDIIHQKKLEIVFDTANTLYQKALELEKEVF
jgi:folate-dependent phosphoribosylglycinamide formyltransferase PurN